MDKRILVPPDPRSPIGQLHDDAVHPSLDVGMLATLSLQLGEPFVGGWCGRFHGTFNILSGHYAIPLSPVTMAMTRGRVEAGTLIHSKTSDISIYHPGRGPYYIVVLYDRLHHPDST